MKLNINLLLLSHHFESYLVYQTPLINIKNNTYIIIKGKYILYYKTFFFVYFDFSVVVQNFCTNISLFKTRC